MELLKIKYRIPIEREYEGWIIAQIEEYFQKINKKVVIFAVSPDDEKNFPADEFIGFEHKAIGLQFKKASLGKKRKDQSSQDYSNVYWDLSNPKPQFPLVQSMKEIYYCLPTFINRDYKSVSLHHCIFWRPDDKMMATTYWYNNDNAKSIDNGNIEKDSLRWGAFIERIYNCEIGEKSSATKATQDIIRDYKVDKIIGEEKPLHLDGLYILYIEM